MFSSFVIVTVVVLVSFQFDLLRAQLCLMALYQWRADAQYWIAGSMWKKVLCVAAD